MSTTHDFMSSLLDEIALEGLDGITLEMLWQRLKDRPNFPITVDEQSKEFFWDKAAKHKDIEIYELPKPRKFEPIYNRYDHVDPELDVVVESAEKLYDPYYPIAPVKDGDVRGSCATYNSRRCITSEIRCDNVLFMPLSQAVEKWGDALVLVASPKARLLSLIGTETNPLIDLSLEAYCLLERIGRSRYLGEVTQGEGGLLALKAGFCRQLHYYRKKLTLKGLITKQNHYMKNKKGTTCTGSLFHLTRFYVQRRTKMATWMKRLCDILKDKPLNREACRVLKEEMHIPDRTFKKLFYRPFQKWVKLITLTCKEFYPNGTTKDWYSVLGHEKIIKVVQLLRHCDDVDMDEKDEEGNDDKGVLPLNVHFDPSRIYFGEPLVYQLFCHIKDAGPEGISAADLGRTMTLPRLDVRCLLGLLSKKGHIITVLQDRGRQKVKKYIAEIYANQNKDYSSLKEQDVIITKEVTSINGETVEQNSVKRKDVDIDEDDINTPASKRTKGNEIVEKPVDDDKVVQNGNRSVEVESNYQNIVSQVLELQNKSHFTGKAPKLVNFVENPNVPPAYSHTSSQVTYRKLKRSNIILDHLRKEHFSTISDLQKHITEKEKEENYSFKLDKKSTARLVYSLYNSKKLKIFKAVLKLEDEQIEIEFICDNDVQSNDPLIQVAIEQAKFKYFGVSKESNKKGNAELKPEATSLQLTGKPACIPVKNTATKEKSLKKAPSSQQPPPDTAHKNPRMTPKFIRAKVLHTFLYYMVYKHKGNPGNSDEQRIYHESISWKRFVPPLPDYGKEGWCFLTDIYSCMPLSLFIKIINFRQGIPNLNHYTENEEKSHYLIKFLPQNLRNSLLNNRKYLFSTNDVIKVLCYMGLVSIGPQVGKQKDQIFLYIHKRASIKDTTISPTGYLHISTDINYEVKSYVFEHEEDVETFWLDLESIAFHTSLGKYSSAVGKTISITEASFKPELVGAIKNKGFEEIVDVGTIPGDGLGAGGFDSVLFLHCRRNWQAAVNTKSTETTRKSNKRQNQNTALVSIQNLLKNTETANSDCRTRLHRLTKNALLTQKEQKSDTQKPTTKKMVSKPIQPVGRKTTRLRTVQLRPNKKRAPYYDEKDKDAMRKMDKARCSWSSQEDSYLLLCKVASSFLDPLYCKNLVVPYTVVRDLLHKQVPEISANKSSRACQRRVRYMMLNSTTINNVNVFLGEALQDTELVREFNKPKPPKSNEEAWREMFTAVMNRLLEKFTMPASDRCKNITIPNNLKELYDNFVLECYEKVSGQDKPLYQEPKCVDDIKKFVLTSLVLSALAIVHDGTKWSYLLHKLYQSFPENAVMSVVNFLREESIVAIKRKTHRIDLQRSLQSTGPYKFSVTYSNAMLTKFPVKIFKESEDLLHNLKSVKPGTYVEVKGDVPPGYAAAVISLMQMGQLSLHTQIPSQIILFDSSLSQEARTNIVERMINTLSEKESVELSRLLNGRNTSSKLSNKENVTNDKSSAVEDVEMLDSEGMPSMMNSSQMSEVQRYASASRFALYLLRQEMSQPPIERVQHSQDYIVLNSCQVYCHLKSDNGFDLPLNPTDVIHKEFDEQKIENFTHISKDKMKLTKNQVMKISHLLTSFIPSEVFDSNQNYLNHVEITYQHYSSKTQLEAKYIFSFIYDSGIIGVTEEEIWQKFQNLTGKLTLFEHLKIFRETNLVIRVGVNSFTYVCGCFAKDWVLTSCPLSDLSLKKGRKKRKLSYKAEDVSDNPNILVLPFCKNDFENDNVQAIEVGSVSSDTQDDCSFCIDETENNLCSQDDQTLSSSSKNCSPLSNTNKIHFIPRTWRNPDGSLNKPVFFNLLSTILSHIISLPGVSSAQVCEQFALVLPPVQILELIEILEKASCIYKYYSKPLKRTSLFSPPGIVKITTNVQPGDMEHLEPFPDAICKMADFRNTMK